MPMSKKEMQRRWAEKEAQMQNIIKNRDWNALFAMDENDDFSWILEQILWSFVTNRENGNLDISNLSHAQKILFLVLELESATQADALPSFFEEGFAVYGREAVQALKEVGASQCAAALSAVVDTLPDSICPKGDKEFWDSIMSGKNADIWNTADSVLVDYTDGWFPDLCRAYAETHRDTVQADCGENKIEFRLADIEDLEELKAMYRQIIKNMNDNNIQIWDDIYPCEFFENDIRDGKMYVLNDKDEIISAFVLCNNNAGAGKVQWNGSSGRSVYLDRLGVNVKYGNRGIGTLMLQKAKEIAGLAGFDYLRLFVVDINIPAVKLYEKNGFIRADGVYDEVFDDGFVLHEYGYEVEV